MEQQRKRIQRWVDHSTLLGSGVVMAVSGLAIQAHYHWLKNPDQSTLWALDRAEWNTVHVWSAGLFLWAVAYHIWRHRKWYMGVWCKRLWAKQRPTLLLTLLAGLVVVTGLIPWVVACFDPGASARFLMIEWHDKLALLFLVVVWRHTAKRRRRVCRWDFVSSRR